MQIGNGDLSAATTVTLGGLTNAQRRELCGRGFGEPPGDTGVQRQRQRVHQQRRQFRADLYRAADPGGSFTNSGTFGLDGNAALTVTGGFTNSGTLDVETPRSAPMAAAA